MNLPTLTKKLVYFKVWATDYTFYIYLLKILGLGLTILYYIGTFFNTQKAKNFNKKQNFFMLARNRAIDAINKPMDDAFNKQFLKGDFYDFKGIRIPRIENTNLMKSVYEDSLKVYVEHDDNYSHTIVDALEKKLPEGTYCYIGKNGEDITVKEGFTVVDAGAWIGDFSAYAAKKGAHVYAFEPSPVNIKMLNTTIDYNKETSSGSITIVPFGLGEKEEELNFMENEAEGNTGANTFNIDTDSSTTKLQVTTIDAWVAKNNIKKIDFLKSDIEGYERYMLKGAKETLKTHAPILSICTYHLPDDREVIRAIILDANPNYKIIQRKMKLFAYV
jgi:FkbM family methyltransferase